MSALIQNLYLVAKLGALWLGGIVMLIEFFVDEAEQGKFTVLKSLTKAVVALLNESM